MSDYSLLVTFHVATVIVWLGCSTTLVFLTLYALRERSGSVLRQLRPLTKWLTLWVLLPASLAAPGFGVLAAHAGGWPDTFFFHVGEGAFTFSFLLTLVVRLPLLRRAGRSAVAAARLPYYLIALALAELTVLYIAVADMVDKPSGPGTAAVRYGAVIVALGLLAAAAVVVRARRRDSDDGVVEPVDFDTGGASPAAARRTAVKR